MVKISTKLVVILVIFIVSVSCIQSDASNNVGEWQIAENQDFGFSIEYPTRLYMFLADEYGYRGRQDVRFIAIAPSTRPPMHLTITVEIRPLANSTLNNVIEWGNEDLDSIKADPVKLLNAGLEEIFLKEDFVGNTKVFRRRYAFRKSELMYEEVYISRRDDMVIISMRVSEADFEESLEVFNRMVESFKPLK